MKLGLGLNLKTSGGTWTPANISSLTHWYKYDTGLTVDGENDVTEWADQKGSNDLTSSGVSNVSPLYASGAVHFNANNDVMTFDSALNLGKFAIYFRWEVSSFSTADFILNVTGDDFLKTNSNTEFRLKIDGGGRHDAAGISAMSVDTKYNLGFEREDTADTTNDQIFIFLDNASKSIAGTGGGTQAITELFTLTSLGKPAADLKLYEVIICSNSLTTSDRSNLNAYLNKI